MGYRNPRCSLRNIPICVEQNVVPINFQALDENHTNYKYHFLKVVNEIFPMRYTNLLQMAYNVAGTKKRKTIATIKIISIFMTLFLVHFLSFFILTWIIGLVFEELLYSFAYSPYTILVT